MLPLWSLSDTNRQENQLLIEALMIQFKSSRAERKHDVPWHCACTPPAGNHVGFFGEDEGTP
jgi:hypothetical protein